MRTSDREKRRLENRATIRIATQAVIGGAVALVIGWTILAFFGLACATRVYRPTAGVFVVTSLLLSLAGLRVDSGRPVYWGAAAALVMLAILAFITSYSTEECTL
jgi:drug/metabolite transporter superfamily protein YnfA